jgi:predicted nucleic acid-binding protein
MKSIADVNVLLPLILEQHSHRAAASAWWNDQPDESVSFTLPVRMAVLRLLTNRALMGTGVLEPVQAWQTLGELSNDARAVVRHDVPIWARRALADLCPFAGAVAESLDRRLAGGFCRSGRGRNGNLRPGFPQLPVIPAQTINRLLIS